jgi:hypothetical protein
MNQAGLKITSQPTRISCLGSICGCGVVLCCAVESFLLFFIPNIISVVDLKKMLSDETNYPNSYK